MMNRSFVVYGGLDMITEFDEALNLSIMIDLLGHLKNYNAEEKKTIELMLKSEDVESKDLAKSMILNGGSPKRK